MATKEKSGIKIGKHVVSITNRQKIYWPGEGFTKGDVIDYYDRMADYILPHLKDRPLSLKRNPNGIRDEGFFHKDAGEIAPPFVKRKKIYSDSTNKDIDYILCDNQATLTYLNNLGCIEINPWHSTIEALDNPDYLIIDIDPSEKNDFDQVVETAQAIGNVLEKAGATYYCKTSGATGLHVYVPLNAKYTYEQARSFGEIIASLTQQQLPGFTSTERSLKKRGNKIYIDYLQNSQGQTIASAYSVRPVNGAQVSAPLLWKEIKKGLHPSQFTIFNMEKRVQQLGDVFYMAIKEGINLKSCLKKLGY